MNTGNTDLVYMEVFRANRFEQVLLSDWLAPDRYGCRDSQPRSLGHRPVSQEPARCPSGLINSGRSAVRRSARILRKEVRVQRAGSQRQRSATKPGGKWRDEEKA
jgi:hypothetical protein